MHHVIKIPSLALSFRLLTRSARRHHDMQQASSSSNSSSSGMQTD
jgi:hypothetical protein